MASNCASSQAFPRKPLPKRFCNLDRVLHALEARDLDGIVVTLPNNVFYLSGFNGIAHKSDEPRVCAVILSRHAPEHPVMVVADYYLATFLTQETWIEDIRPIPRGDDAARPPGAEIRHRPLHPARRQRQTVGGDARKQYAFDMGSALKGVLRELQARPRQGRLRRRGVRAKTWYGWPCRRRRL